MYRILVADDEPIERQVMYKKINSFFPNQVEVYTAENGIEAVNTCREKNCQISILDIAMPGMDGLEAAEIIRGRDKDCSIVFLTAFDEFSFAKKAIEVRALDYLLKPGSDNEIVNVLEEAFRISDKSQKEREKSVREEKSQEWMAPGNCQEYKQSTLISEISDYIEKHYVDDIALQDIAGYLGYSDVYFCKLFKQNFGKNFITYLNEYRMDKAKELLANPMINIKDVGQKAGYRDANYFTRLFKRLVGETPSEYRNKVWNT